MKIKTFFRCVKYYVLLKIWEHYYWMEKKLDHLSDPVNDDQELEKFRNWYWTGRYEDDFDAYDRNNFN